MSARPSLGSGRILWGRSLAWLALLGPFFFLSYGFANSLAAARGDVASLYFEWEHAIPFWPWTIVPYWSIDLLYGLSFLFCRARRVVDRHALRLLTAQLIAVLCFLLFPLRFAFERPAVEGVFGALFDALAAFDQPFNQAPSLHIALLVIIWVRFHEGLRSGGGDGSAHGRAHPAWRWLVHGWALLIGVSVLTTWQHHFIDVPTGALLGLLCVWLWPDQGPSPLVRRPAWGRSSGVSARLRIALGYALTALLLGVFANRTGGVALWLWWPASALAMVALIYACCGPAGFTKHGGRHDLAAALVLAPYVVGAWINSRLWTWRHPQPDAVAAEVWLGRMPSAASLRQGGFAALCDLCAELPAPRGVRAYAGLPWLDLVAPTPLQLAEAARRIEGLQGAGPVLVCCALGYSRSACAVAAWLLYSGLEKDVEAAIGCVKRARPGVVLHPAHRAALTEFAASCVPSTAVGASSGLAGRRTGGPSTAALRG